MHIGGQTRGGQQDGGIGHIRVTLTPSRSPEQVLTQAIAAGLVTGGFVPAGEEKAVWGLCVHSQVTGAFGMTLC